MKTFNIWTVLTFNLFMKTKLAWVLLDVCLFFMRLIWIC